MRHNLNRVVQRWLRRVSRRNYNQLNPRPFKEPPTAIVIPQDYKSVVKSLVDRKALTTLVYAQRKTKEWHNVHPDIKKFAQAFQKECEKRGIPVWLFETMRTPTRQNELRAQGRSKAKAWGSPHQFGCAVDIVCHTRLWNYSKRQWDLIGIIGKEVARKQNLKIEWGGDWGFYDPAHWQLKEWRKYREAYLDDPANAANLTQNWFEETRVSA